MSFSRSFWHCRIVFHLGRISPAWLLGATLAGALPLIADTENAATIRVGVFFQADFAVTGAPSGARSYTISGLPPGLAVPGAAFSAGVNTYTLNSPYCTVSGTPTAEGNYPLTVTAREQANGSGAGATYGYGLTVSAKAADHQVVDAIITTGHEAIFSAGNTVGTIRWQISTDSGTTWSDLANAAPYSGVTGTTLTVAGVAASLNGARYRFHVVNGSGVAVSNGARLTVVPAFFPYPTGITTDGSGNLVICDANTNTVRKISASGAVSLLAGNSGTAGTVDGLGSAARFNQPAGLAAVGGAVFVADTANATIRRIGSDGTVTTLAGAASSRGSLDGTGTAAHFSQPVGLSADAAGNLYVADAMNHTVRKVTAAGVVTTVAGLAGAAGSADGIGSVARFNLPTGVAVRANGSLVVSDTVNHLLRTVSATGVVGTLAGLAGVSGFADGTGDAALFSRPGGLAVDGAGNIFVADTANSTIRRVTPAGLVTTLAGLPGVSGLLDGAGLNALFNQPQSLTFDAAGNLYVVDTGNAAIRKVTAAGVVTTVVLYEAAAPPAVPAPAPPTTPSQAPTPAPSPAPESTPAASGGGGGAMSPGFSVLVASLLLARLRRPVFRPAQPREAPEQVSYNR